MKPDRRRVNRPDDWTALPADGCRLAAPKWPGPGKAPALWARLWALPVAEYWHALCIEPTVVARYVNLSETKPESPAVSKLETELGLTPAAMLRLRLVVVAPEPEEPAAPSPYEHLRAVE